MRTARFLTDEGFFMAPQLHGTPFTAPPFTGPPSWNPLFLAPPLRMAPPKDGTLLRMAPPAKDGTLLSMAPLLRMAPPAKDAPPC